MLLDSFGGRERTASSTVPNSSNLARRALSSVCHARPLCLHQRSKQQRGMQAWWTYPMKSLDILSRTRRVLLDYHSTQSLNSHTKRTVVELTRKQMAGEHGNMVGIHGRARTRSGGQVNISTVRAADEHLKRFFCFVLVVSGGSWTIAVQRARQLCCRD